MRRLVAQSVIEEATGYYKLVVATATLFLGGTLLFWEKITPTLSVLSLLLLGIGWLFLIGSVMLVVFVQRDNIEMGRLVLADDLDNYEPVAKRSRRLTTASGICLAIGMFFVSAAGMAALGEKAMNEKRSSDSISDETLILQKSLPFKEIAQSAGGTNPSQQGNQSGTGDKSGGSQEDKKLTDK